MDAGGSLTVAALEFTGGGVEEMVAQELGGRLGLEKPGGVSQDLIAAREGADHEAVPRGEDFVVEMGAGTETAFGEERGAVVAKAMFHVLNGAFEAFGDGLVGKTADEDVEAFEFAVGIGNRGRRCRPARRHRRRKIQGQRSSPRTRRPHHGSRHKKRLGLFGRVFFRQAVGILRGKVGAGAVGMAEVLHDVAQDAGGGADKKVGGEADLRELGLIVEHFLEVGDMPFGVDGIAMKTAAEMIVHAAAGHFAEGVKRHAEGRFGFVGGAVFLRGEMEKEFEIDRARKFRRAAEAPLAGVKHAGVLGEGERDGGGGIPGAVGRGAVFRFGLAQSSEKRLSPLLDLPAVGLPDLGDAAQDGDETGAAGGDRSAGNRCRRGRGGGRA